MKKTILVTGATGLIGSQLVRRLLADGFRVVGTSRRPAALDSFAAALPSGADFVSVVADLAEGGGARLAERLGIDGIHPHVVVNNAFDMANQRPDARGGASRAQWITEFDYAVVAPYELVVGLSEPADARLESVINIASMYGVVPRNPGLYNDPRRESPIHYGVAKAAMIHLTRELAVRLAPRGIRVNAVSYGGVEGRVDDAFKARYARLCPSGRMLKPEETAGIVAMLASLDSTAVTGQNLIVDGGFTVW